MKNADYIPIPVLSIDTSAPGTVIDSRKTPDCQNVRINRTEIQKREGFTAMGFSAVGDPAFTGSGLDDLSTGGNPTTGKSYKVEIDGTGTPDTFKWSDDGGTTWNATGVSITGNAQSLSAGVTITFGATTGHTLGDYWTFSTIPGTVQYIIEHNRESVKTLCRVTTKKFQVWNNSKAGWVDYTGATD